MNRIIKRRERREVLTYALFYENPLDAGSGFSFDCDVAGNVFLSKLTDVAKDNLDRCQKSDWPVTVVTYRRWSVTPAIIKCDCGRELGLSSGWANTCQCGREYNGSGQLLAPRSQWGQETGETFTTPNWTTEE